MFFVEVILLHSGAISLVISCSDWRGCTVTSLSPDGSTDLQRDTVMEANPSDCNQRHKLCGGAVNCCKVCDDALLGGEGVAGCGGREEVGVATVLAFEGIKSIMSPFLKKLVVAGLSKCSQFLWSSKVHCSFIACLHCPYSEPN
jgi:hypothetical protein